MASGKEIQHCECHGEPMYWSKKASIPSGGSWKCAVTARERQRVYQKTRYDSDPEYRARMNRQNAENSRQRRFGITADDYLELLEGQDRRCAICGTTEPGSNLSSFCVDHDHSCCDGDFSCGRCIRGLLCLRCNRVLGFVNDDVMVLQQAIDYLGGDQ